MRKLSNQFENDLLNGCLTTILNLVKKDNSLDMQIRDNYINIYYRGGNILKISLKNNIYSYAFNSDYFNSDSEPSKGEVNKYLLDMDWIKYFAFTKHIMDIYFTVHRKEEREYQQLIVRENNYTSISNGTDYFIVDIEYNNHKNARFDIVALEWISESSARRLSRGYKPKLVIFEMKYGDGALTGKSGIRKHLDDFKTFMSDTFSVNHFKNEMLEVFSQKRRLGLIPCLSGRGKNNNAVVDFAEKIEFVFIMANHDPASIKLKREIENYSNFYASFSTSNFMGYALFKNTVFNCQDFLTKFSNQIYEH